MNLNVFMKQGIKNITNTATRFYLNNRKGREFMVKMGVNLHNSAKLRENYEQNGTHIPPFLIASIASDCNLHCTGCYARANGGCGENAAVKKQMDLSGWNRTFREASEIGVSFILLAGGEPLLRRSIIKMASSFDKIIFPIFTNGTIIDEQYLQLFDAHRNLIPILSVEGGDARTDARRGRGVSAKIQQAIERLQKMKILFGASITVTSQNMYEVSEQSYLTSLYNQGCGIIFYVEYVPVETHTDHLILSGSDLQVLQERISILKAEKQNKSMILISFPGDEEKMGGCLAAGRGFFHINPDGGAEPCPFSPYSELNLRKHSLIDVLNSPFFKKVREISAAESLNHKGGCTIFHHKDEVLAAKNS